MTAPKMKSSKSRRSLRFASVDDMPDGMRALYQAQIRPEAELVLPWPDRALHPNARVHWAKKSSVTKAARGAAKLKAIEAGWQNLAKRLPSEGRLYVHIDGYPRIRRNRDRDGLQASLKAALDGIAEAMDVNDTRFFPITDVRDELRPPFGEVRIRITTSMEAE